MQKSIFSKYFSICASLILMSILVLGIVFLVFAVQFLKDEQLEGMKNTAAHTVEMVEDRWYSTDPADKTVLREYLHTLADSMEQEIFITDRTGITLYCTEYAPCKHTDMVLSQEILDQLRTSGSYSELGKFNDLYNDRYYTTGAAAQTPNGVLYVFVTANATGQQRSFLGGMIEIFLISAALVLVITCIAVYFVTAQFVHPLREMANAATKFGRGEFDTRLEVTDYDEVGQLAMALNNMAQSLSTTESARRSFTANISHELKTPMTSISGFVDGILDGTIPPEQHRHYLTLVSDETKRLSRLVRTMLNLSRIEAGEMEINRTKVNMLDTIIQSLLTFERQIEEKRLDIRGLDHEKVVVEADPDLIHQVVYNLIENAVKFVNEDGYLEFAFSNDVRYTYISVKNSGAGLTKEEIPKIFDRFYKTDRSRGLDKNGVGLGLYIVRSVIKLHGGEIAVRSNEGEFVEFVFSIPHARTMPKFMKNNG